MAHHGVELVERSDDRLDLVDGLALSLGQSFDVLFLSGNELVQRGIQEADGNRFAFHGLIESLEVALLHGLQLCQSGLALLDGIGADHLTDGGDTVGIEEHVLGAAEADAFCAEVKGVLGVLGGVGVGADLQLTELVGPAHQGAEVAGDGSGNGGKSLAVDVAGGAIKGDVVALNIGAAGQGEALVLFVHLDVAAAGNAAGAHAAGHNGSVRGHAAADGEDALSVVHAFDVFRRGLQTDQDDLLALFRPLGGVFSGEDDPAAGSSGRGGKSGAHGLGSLQGLGVKLRMEQSVQLLGVDHADSLSLGDHAFVDQVNGDLQSSGGGALAVTGLEHIELLVLDGELHILHIPVVILELCTDVHELSVGFGHDLSQLVNGLRSTDAGHDVFALSVHQELAEQLLLTGRGAAGKGNAGAGGIAQIAEDHHLDVDGSAPRGGDVVHSSVVDCTGVVPRTEHSLDGAHQLLLGIVGEVAADFGFVLGFELRSKLLQILSGELHVLLDALLLLHLVDELLEVFLADFHNNVGVHLDEAAVAVPGPAGVVGLLGHDLDDLFVQAEVQDGVHHAGHGSTRAGTDGDQQGVLVIAELLAGDAFHLGDVLHDLSLDLIVDGFAVGVVLGAGFGGNGEALGNRHAQIGHFSKVCTFAAEQLAHFAVALGKEIHVFLLHFLSTSNNIWIAGGNPPTFLTGFANCVYMETSLRAVPGRKAVRKENLQAKRRSRDGTSGYAFFIIAKNSAIYHRFREKKYEFANLTHSPKVSGDGLYKSSKKRHNNRSGRGLSESFGRNRPFIPATKRRSEMYNNLPEGLKKMEEKRLAVLEKYADAGVIFEGIDGVVIEETVVIGVGTRIEPGVVLKGDTIIGEGCLLTSGSRVEDCVIGDRTIINASQCYRSRIGNEVTVGPFSHIRPDSDLADHVHIGDFVEVKNSFIGVGTSVSHLTYVGDSDVGRNVNFGCGCVTVNYDGVNKHRCRIGDNAFIGCNTNLVAPVEVGDNTFIAAGSTITDAVADGDFAIARARQVNKKGLGAKKLKDRKLKY